MPTVKPNKLAPLTVLGMFGQSYKKFKHAGRLARLIMEIGFKLKGVYFAYDLIVKQEEVINKLHSDKPKGVRSYREEEKQMAYIGFFLDAVYKLTEKTAMVTKILHDGNLKEGFNRQREQIMKNPKVNPPLAKLLKELEWYDKFRELRTEDTHFGTAVLGYGFDKEPKDGYSQLIIEIAGKGKKKVLTGDRYNFDVRKTVEIRDGVSKYVQDWALIMLKRLDPNTTMTGLPQVKKELILKDFLKGR